MKVRILCEFEVPDAENERDAKAAASQAAWGFLSFCTATDANAGRDECTVHVDGVGELTVRIGRDHE
jgi:hypothetical protein